MTETSVPADDTSVRLRRRSQKKGALLFVRDVLVIFVVALLVSFLIKTFLVRSFFIPSSSMEQTLQIDDRILVNELVPDLVELQRGDVVVFRDPGGWLPPTAKPTQPPLVAAVDWVMSAVGLSASDSDDHLIKRVIGLPGDHVVCCNTLGQLTVNGVPLQEPYVTVPAGVTSVSKDAFDVTVPANSLWVMGDNRYNSKDSRYNREQPGNGFVPVDNVVGRAFVISWPSARWEWLDNYPSVFAGIRESNG
ncbi:signal peptidase I [Mycetocola zhadangensis]|uniref:Signal peptidase I n=1 Tax=Mycetocola zhadangensis TaxID=1164595 RepID=A0A3L7J570_9MICO|nr:signal peptidase I [Mycetocola zhadangensis]RLQ85858.1 signal peptidase I [Mycetocola zhadangensis]GGE86461.1 signal peptidase I [Mycetocola zhadangensis]